MTFTFAGHDGLTIVEGDDHQPAGFVTIALDRWVPAPMLIVHVEADTDVEITTWIAAQSETMRA